MTQLECEILKVINETIGGKYIGKLRVTKEDNIYCLAMFLNLTVNPAFSLIKAAMTAIHLIVPSDNLFASAFNCGAFFPVPFPIFCTVCFHPFNACRIVILDSVLLIR